MEIDTIGLYPNFGDKSLEDVIYQFEKFCLRYKIDPKGITLAYKYYDYDTISKYGFHDGTYDNLKWLESVGCNRLNTFTDIRSEVSDYTVLYNYVISHKSLAIFIGAREGQIEKEYEFYIKTCKCHTVPVITLIPDQYAELFWVGRPDRDLTNYLDHLS
jgi:hypothetical protein